MYVVEINYDQQRGKERKKKMKLGKEYKKLGNARERGKESRKEKFTSMWQGLTTDNRWVLVQ